MNCEQCPEMATVTFDEMPFKWCKKYQKSLGPLIVRVIPCQECLEVTCHS